MPAESNTPPGSDDLQFDSAVDAGGASAPVGMACTNCGKTIQGHYFQANGRTVCSSCKMILEQTAASLESAGVDTGQMARAALFGLGGAIAGAVVYYAWVVITKTEWALVAIAVAWIVGKAVRAGSQNRGGPPYQILAVALTYLALGLAYVPLIPGGLGGGIVSVVTLAFSAPIRNALGSGAFGIINVIIIAVGLQYAWKMNAVSAPVITGPYRVGASA